MLQTQNPEETGFVNEIGQDYCQRCFRLIHYDDITHFKACHLNNAYIQEIYERYRNELFVLIVDLLDAFCLEKDNLMEYFKGKDVLLVINKTDILPANIRDEKLLSVFTKTIRKLRKNYPGIKAAIMSNKFEHEFNEKFYDTVDELKRKRIVFAGRANAGKSTLINKLLQENVLTTSVYPGTTLNETVIEHDGYTFIDTPGLADQENYTTYLDLETSKKMKIAKAIKPQIFQFHSKQSYFYEGLLRVDVDPQEQASIIFYVSNDYKIHRSPYAKADQYFRNQARSFALRAPLDKQERFEIKDRQLFIIKGMGMFKVNGKCEITVHIHPDVAVYRSEEEI